MSINSLADWNALELKAQTHELAQVDTPKVPEPLPEHIRARLQAKVREAYYDRICASLKRKNNAMAESLMYLSIGETGRAQEVLNRGLLDI